MEICKCCGQEKKTNWTKIGNLKWSEDLGEMNWFEAEKLCKEMGGRLPTRIELFDLVDNHSEEIEDWDSSYYYWSATTFSSNTQYAWYVNLNYGYTYYSNKTNSANYRVRCVR